MSIFDDLTTLFKQLNIPAQAVEFTESPPDTYAVFIPISDELDFYADDYPQYENQAVRIMIFTKSNYILFVRRITKALLENDFDVTDRQYVRRETDTGYHHYAIDIEKDYCF